MSINGSSDRGFPGPSVAKARDVTAPSAHPEPTTAGLNTAWRKHTTRVS